MGQQQKKTSANLKLGNHDVGIKQNFGTLLYRDNMIHS